MDIKTRIRKRWRAWLRAIHRDIGYLLVGLTFVYAISGIAINHLGEWDPNFKSVVETHEVQGPFDDDPDVAASQLLSQRGISEESLRAAFWDSETVLELNMDERVLRLDIETMKVKEASKEPRFFLRVANWLHVNRGKGAWTWVADIYAVLLLYLASSGVLMLRGRKGFWGRGAILIGIGIAVPIAYVHFSGGP